jgi:ribosomal protein S27AE
MSTAPMVRRFPTRLRVRCPQCLHQGVVMTFIAKPPRLKCSKCGSRDAVVVERDRTRTWMVSRARRRAASTTLQ